MNNLNGLRCYLSYPIEFASSEESFNKEILCSFLEMKGTKILDPKKIKFDGISEIEERKQLFEDNDFKEIRKQMKKIVRKDLRCVDISDFIIALLPKDIKTTGTTHEIIESDRQRKPTLIVCPEGIKHIPIWFFGIVPVQYMFDSIEKLVEYLNFIDEHDMDCEDAIFDDRWQFIINDLADESTGF